LERRGKTDRETNVGALALSDTPSCQHPKLKRLHHCKQATKLAETLRLKVASEERGEDVGRAENWELTIEEIEEWEKLARKKRRADYEFHGQPFRLDSNWILTRKQTTPMLRSADTRKT
jgi:hypothetical protein